MLITLYVNHYFILIIIELLIIMPLVIVIFRNFITRDFRIFLRFNKIGAILFIMGIGM